MPEPVPTASQVNIVTMKMVEKPKDVSTNISSVEGPGVGGGSTPPPSKRTVQNRGKDSSWLEIEACREYLRDDCPRGEGQCRFAHPEDKSLVSDDGKLITCYDFLKDRCHREYCKYFHPPPHIKDRLVDAGKQFGAMMSGLYATVSVPSSPLPVTSPVPSLVSYDGGCIIAPPGPFCPYGMSSDKMPICPEFVRGLCHIQICPFAHPEHYVRRNTDLTVTICRDFLQSCGCSRDQCRYFHPPPYIFAQMEAAMSGLSPGFVTPQGMFVSASFMPGFQQSGPVMFQPGGAMLQPGGAMLQPYMLATSTSAAAMHTTIPTQPFVYQGLYGQNRSPAAFVPATFQGGLSGGGPMSSQTLSAFSRQISPQMANSMSYTTAPIYHLHSVQHGIHPMESSLPTTSPLNLQVSEVQTIPQNITSSHPIHV